MPSHELTPGRQKDIPVQVLHNASVQTSSLHIAMTPGDASHAIVPEVMNAVASCGLQLYRFGETVSIPYWLDDWRPDSWYDSKQQLGFLVMVFLMIFHAVFLAGVLSKNL